MASTNMRMDKKEISACIRRYKEIIGILKQRPGLGTQQLIAEAILYRRGETISEYGNIRSFKESRFREFIGLLDKVFDVNPEYIFRGQHPRFHIREADLAPLLDVPFSGSVTEQIASVEYAIALLDAEIAQLKSHRHPNP